MRLFKVALVLLALGAISGAIVGMLVMLAFILLRGGGFADGFAWPAFGAAAAFGAGVGALFGPVIALVFLRRVPLWRATFETAGAAGLGAALAGPLDFPYAWAAGAFTMAMLATLRLRRVYREKMPKPSSEIP
jgi:hypothetical protein